MDPRIDVNFSSLSHADYGGNAGVWRILEILERQKVRAMVLVNSLAAEKWPDAVRALHQAGHEIAGHGATNEVSMVELGPEEQKEEIDAYVHAELGGRPYLAVGFERIIEYVNRRRSEIWQPTYREVAEYCLET